MINQHGNTEMQEDNTAKLAGVIAITAILTLVFIRVVMERK